VKGLTTAPLAAADALPVARMWHDCELHDDGRMLVTEEDFVTALQRPSLDFGRDTVAVRDGDAIVAAGLLFGERFVFANVAPSHRGRGVGTWLLRWSEDAGRAAGRDRSCQKLSETSTPGSRCSRRPATSAPGRTGSSTSSSSASPTRPCCRPATRSARSCGTATAATSTA
jgi:GNAT superfamily N-acetyltransferase